jgi:hypothetical protein
MYSTPLHFSLKLHHEKRPLSMKTDIIKKRQRYENGPAAPKGRPSRKGKQEDEADNEGMSPPANNSDDEDDSSDPNMDYSFQYPQNNNNNNQSSSGSGSTMMTGY